MLCADSNNVVTVGRPPKPGLRRRILELLRDVHDMTNGRVGLNVMQIADWLGEPYGTVRGNMRVIVDEGLVAAKPRSEAYRITEAGRTQAARLRHEGTDTD